MGNVHHDKTPLEIIHFAVFFLSTKHMFTLNVCVVIVAIVVDVVIIYLVIVFGIPELFGMRSDSALAFQPQAATDQGRDFFVQNQNNCFLVLTICVKQQFLDSIWFKVKCLSQGQLLFA